MTVLAAVDGSDVLTEVLASVRLRGRLFCRTELAAPWGLAMAAGREAHFHLVEKGRCVLRLGDGEADVELEEGDFLVLPHSDGHVLASGAGAFPVAVENLARDATRAAGFATFRHGGNGPKTTLVCGSFRFEERAAHPLLSLLPKVLLIRADSEGSSTVEWLKTSLRFLGEEAQQPRPGTEALISRLTDMLFVQVLRLWIEAQPLGAGGWMGALRDPQISKVLGAMHREPRRAWTVTSLADEAGMSRSSFAARFSSTVGEAPLAYLTRWRMQLASDLLRGQSLSVAEVASRVGYESEAGFSKAFRRQFDVTPGQIRREAAAVAS